MKKKTKTKEQTLTKKQFIKIILTEIDGLSKTYPYHAFVNISALVNFCRNELGINVFTNPSINTALTNMTNHYAPKTVWVIDKENKKQKHLKVYKKKLVLSIDKLIIDINKAISKTVIKNTKYLTINE